jgi:hypothetical protein
LIYFLIYRINRNMKCEYCKRECKNLNSLTQHRIRCKENPDKILVKSNFIEYNKRSRDPERKQLNHFSKAKLLGLESPVMSKETREKISKGNKGKKLSEESKKKLSESMARAVKENPDSYSRNNVCGRTKLMETLDSLGNPTKVNGGWEFLVSEYLSSRNIRWTNKIKEEFIYFWDGKERRYYPDFYLIDYGVYLEVKGYERERDLLKWETLKDRLIVIKKKEIDLIKKDLYEIKLKG